MEISKSLLQYVSLGEKGSHRKNALLGAAVGLRIGAPIGATMRLADREPAGRDRMACAAVFGGIFGAIGALIGAAAGGSRTTKVYPAR
jgi:hypothetical protein